MSNSFEKTWQFQSSFAAVVSYRNDNVNQVPFFHITNKCGYALSLLSSLFFHFILFCYSALPFTAVTVVGGPDKALSRADQYGMLKIAGHAAHLSRLIIKNSCF